MRAQFGDVTFDSDTREVTRGGEVVHISPKAFQLLHILLEKRPNAVSKEELIERLWPDVIVEEANLKNLVVEVRRVLGQPNVIRTIHRFGYAFSGGESAGERKRTAKLIGADGVFRLRPGEYIIGRADDCSVVIDVAGVSRHHARLMVSDSGAAEIEDLGSKNGTWVNGTRLSGPRPLENGDEIDIGVARLVYRPSSSEESTLTLDAVRA